MNTLNNANAVYGITGNVTATGNTAIDNTGIWTGNYTQTAAPGYAATTNTFLNDVGGSFYGAITNGSDLLTITNNGTMTAAGSVIYGNITNTGLFSPGTIPASTTPALVQLNGNFTQSAAGTYSETLTSGTSLQGVSYGQLVATGKVTLAGTLNVVPVAGYYTPNSTFTIITANGGLTGNFTTLTGNVTAFETFTESISGNTVLLTYAPNYTGNLYAKGINDGNATPNMLAVATGFQGVANFAATNASSTAATLVGEVNGLSIPQAQSLFEQMSPEGYGAYATGMRDQANNFARFVEQRLNELHVDDEVSTGAWAQAFGGFDGASATGAVSSFSNIGSQFGYDIGNDRFLLGASLGYEDDGINYGYGNGIPVVATNAALNTFGTTTAYGNVGMSGHDLGYQLGGYGRLNIGRAARASLDLVLSYQFETVHATRTMNESAVFAVAQGDTHGHAMTATSTLGYDMGGESLKLRPFVGLDMTKGN
ncbi:MAG: hypothetical protein KGJ05_09185, partial [Alphaproteobacteria bacterium]|nr:hypothetical protein [Alphaproteobacteria bacterium]